MKSRMHKNGLYCMYLLLAVFMHKHAHLQMFFREVDARLQSPLFCWEQTVVVNDGTPVGGCSLGRLLEHFSLLYPISTIPLAPCFLST